MDTVHYMRTKHNADLHTNTVTMQLKTGTINTT